MALPEGWGWANPDTALDAIGSRSCEATYDVGDGSAYPDSEYDYETGAAYRYDEASHTLTFDVPVAVEKLPTQVVFDASLPDKVEDGVAVTAPAYHVSGSTGAVTEMWQRSDGHGGWDALSDAPSRPGVYRFVVSVAEDAAHDDATAYLEFEIHSAAAAGEDGSGAGGQGPAEGGTGSGDGLPSTGEGPLLALPLFAAGACLAAAGAVVARVRGRRA